MLIFYLAVFLLVLWKIKFISKGYNEEYLSKECTNAIKGIFILLVFIGHALQYVDRSDYAYDIIGDRYALRFKTELGQMVVTMFLFYSGYGVVESIKKKGETYINSIPKRRILSTFLNFDVAVLFFLALSLILSIHVTIKQFGLSLLAWDSLGNSNWYIFCILVCYALAYLSFKAFGNDKNSIITMAASIIATSILISYYKEPWWYNTMWAFGLGGILSYYRVEIDGFAKKHYLIILSCLMVALFVVHKLPFEYRGIMYNIESCIFALLIVCITMKVRISNSILLWCGINLFPLYIYERLPMIAIEHECKSLISTYPYLFILLSLIVTVFISWAYKYWRITLK